MKHFHLLLQELKTLHKSHVNGNILQVPKRLNSVQIENKRIAYLKMGIHKEEPAIVCLHGFCGCFLDWPKVLVPLSKYHPIYAPDLIGWGFSEARPDCFTMEHEVRILYKFLEALNLKRVILVGISYGAAVTLMAAANKNPIIERIILLNPMPPHPLKFMGSFQFNLIFHLFRYKKIAGSMHKIFFTKKHFVKSSLTYIRNKRKLDKFYTDFVYSMLKQPHIIELFNRFAMAAKNDDWNSWEKKIQEITIPTLILKGDEDEVFDRKSLNYLKELIPHAEVELIRNCGHGMLHDKYRYVIIYIMREMQMHLGLCVLDKPHSA